MTYIWRVQELPIVFHIEGHRFCTALCGAKGFGRRAYVGEWVRRPNYPICTECLQKQEAIAA